MLKQTSFKSISPEALTINPFTMINKEWMLLTAGTQAAHNTMTVSWGSLGELWGRYVSTVHIRPQRYTKEFVDAQTHYSLCVFEEQYREALNFCGSKSGRDVDKAKECGLTPVFDRAAPYYAEAKLVMICRKLYRQEMQAADFLDKSLVDTCYPAGDFHWNYIGELEEVLVR